ncbi:hypothetical protein JF66_19215 [Cryobacterium sp. MLB-32]|nr:hypothetical protein JF66_19215 [Cryobacterium sp. MLB-32]
MIAASRVAALICWIRSAFENSSSGVSSGRDAENALVTMAASEVFAVRLVKTARLIKATTCE